MYTVGRFFGGENDRLGSNEILANCVARSGRDFHHRDLPTHDTVALRLVLEYGPVGIPSNDPGNLRDAWRVPVDGFTQPPCTTVFSDHRLQRFFVQAEIRHHVLQSPVLILEFLQPARLAHFQPAELALPGVQYAFAHAHFARQIRDFPARLHLLQHTNDLLLAEPRLLHLQAPFVANSYASFSDYRW